MKTSPASEAKISGKAIPVVFCADVNVLDCLAVAVASVLGHASRPVDVYVFHDGLSEDAKRFLAGVAARVRRAGGELRFEAINLAAFEQYDSLHGNWMTYARLLLHKALPHVDRVVYLDADITAHRDVFELWETDLAGRPLAGVCHCLKSASLEQAVWQRLGSDANTPYYNAGVLTIDLSSWRRLDLDAVLQEYFSRTKGLKTVVDQTALNAVFDGQWADLPGEWNTPCWPNTRLSSDQQYALLHYVGAPKPWDLMGRWLHPESERFFATAQQWGVNLPAAHAIMPAIPRYRRAARLARSYAKAIAAKAGRR